MINNFDECLEIISQKHFFIKDENNTDDKKPAYIIDVNGEFEVINNTSEAINFLKIDSCMYDSTDDTRCDCSISNDETICFIELKHTKRTAWKRWRETAEKQLEATIKEFKTSNLIQNKTIEAYMCCTCTIDDKITKISRATNNSETVTRFENELDAALYCKTTKEFK